MSKDDLELLSFTDIAYQLIKEDMKTVQTALLFKEICQLLELEKNHFEDKIADFFTSLTTDKRFILLKDGTWDIKEKHSLNLSSEDNEDDLNDLEIDELDEDEFDEFDEFDDLDEEENELDFNDDLNDLEEDDEDDEFVGLEILDETDEDDE